MALIGYFCQFSLIRYIFDLLRKNKECAIDTMEPRVKTMDYDENSDNSFEVVLAKWLVEIMTHYHQPIVEAANKVEEKQKKYGAIALLPRPKPIP